MSPDDEQPADTDSRDRLSELGALGEQIAVAVDDHGETYVERRVRRVLDAWERLDGDERVRVDRDVSDAAHAGTRRVVGELRALLAEPPDRQRSTPLEIVRTIGREVTAVLRQAGVAAVVRDDFDERSFPDDLYDLAPHTLGDLAVDPVEQATAADTDPAAVEPADADESGGLGALQLAWGLAKARAMRADPPPDPRPDPPSGGPD